MWKIELFQMKLRCMWGHQALHCQRHKVTRKRLPSNFTFISLSLHATCRQVPLKPYEINWHIWEKFICLHSFYRRCPKLRQVHLQRQLLINPSQHSLIPRSSLRYLCGQVRCPIFTSPLHSHDIQMSPFFYEDLDIFSTSRVTSFLQIWECFAISYFLFSYIQSISIAYFKRWDLHNLYLL